jgi:hypothetical protein
MDHGTCVIGEGDCSKTGKLTRGWCQKHYQRWQRCGDYYAVGRIFGDDAARFWSYVDKRGPDECWPWTGYVSEAGYGVFSVGGNLLGAHVWAYEHFVGPVPEDKPELDHACHSNDDDCEGGVCLHRRCVNFTRFDDPLQLHLEAVTSAENARRAHQSKVSGARIAALYDRRLAGERTAALAAEVGMQSRTLTARFRRLAARGELTEGRVRLSDEQVIALHARWQAGEHIDVLVAESGAKRAAIYKRFSRLTA